MVKTMKLFAFTACPKIKTSPEVGLLQFKSTFYNRFHQVLLFIKGNKTVKFFILRFVVLQLLLFNFGILKKNEIIR